jgi:hypothetical protein
MQIIYDAQIFSDQKAGGISRYHYELFSGIFANMQNDLELFQIRVTAPKLNCKRRLHLQSL